MKHRFVLQAALMLATALAGQAGLAAPTAHAEASNVLATNFGPQESCNPTSTTATSASAGCALTDTQFGSASLVSGSAFATAGVLRAAVIATVGSDYADTRLVGWNTAANGGVSASQQDTLTLSAPGLEGTRGTLVGAYIVHGSASATVIGTQNADTSGNDSFANVTYSGRVGVGTASASFSGRGDASIDVPGPTPSTPQPAVQLTTDFFFGVPFTVSSSIAMDWSIAARRVILYSAVIPGHVPVDYVDSKAGVKGDFGNTIYWGGLLSVTDSSGQAVAYTASSASGFDYVNAAAVPEPTTALLMLAGLLAITAVFKRSQPTPKSGLNLKLMRKLAGGALLSALLAPAHAYTYGGSVQAGAGWRDGTFGLPSGAFASPGLATAIAQIADSHMTAWSNHLGFSTEVGSGTGNAQAAPGALHLLAAGSGSFSNAQAFAPGGRGSGDASGFVDDSFIITSSALPAGSLVTMVFAFDVAGALSAGGSAHFDGNAQWSASLHLVGTGSACGCTTVDWSGGQSLTSSWASPPHTTGTGSFGSNLFTATVLTGSPVNLHITGSVHAAANANNGELIGEGNAAYSANLANTVGWGGIQELRDANGALLTNYSAISSSSGFDYRQSAVVPEPPAAALLLLGLAGIGARGRTRR